MEPRWRYLWQGGTPRRHEEAGLVTSSLGKPPLAVGGMGHARALSRHFSIRPCPHSVIGLS